MVVHFHHKHSGRQEQWEEIAKELHGPNVILRADHNSLKVNHQNAFAPLSSNMARLYVPKIKRSQPWQKRACMIFG